MSTRKHLVGMVALLSLVGAAACSDPVALEQATDISGPVLDGIGWTGSGTRSDTAQIEQQQGTTEGGTSAETTGIGWTGSGH